MLCSSDKGGGGFQPSGPPGSGSVTTGKIHSTCNADANSDAIPVGPINPRKWTKRYDGIVRTYTYGSTIIPTNLKVDTDSNAYRHGIHFSRTSLLFKIDEFP